MLALPRLTIIMFERFRQIMARLTREPRYPAQSYAPTSTRTLAGVSITPGNAAQITAVWGCVKYISESIAHLPWHVMRATEDGKEEARNHPVDWLLWRRPAKEWSSFQFRETLAHWALLWGNGYAEIERDQFGRPFALWPIHPDRVRVCRDPDTRELYYEVDTGGDGARVELDPSNVFHLRGFGHGPVGLNVAEYVGQTFGWAKAATIFGATFFGNGMSPAGIVTNKNKLTEGGLKRQKAEFEALHKGPRNANKTAFLDNDAQWQPIGFDPSKAQMIEVHHFLVEEICRVFAVPPHIVAELSRSTNNNIEHQGIEATQRCLTPWVKRFEDEADGKLFGVRDRGFYTKMNMSALMRGDFKSQAEGFRMYKEMGVYSTNEVRQFLDANKISKAEGGDKYTMNGSYMTLEQIGEIPEVAPATPAPQSRRPSDLLPDEISALAEIEREHIKCLVV